MMPLPVHEPRDADRRSADEVRALALMVQANLVQLKTTALRRPALAPLLKGIDVPSPGAVRTFREALLTPEALRAFANADLLVHLHECWGQYCALCWAHETDVHGPRLNFATLPLDTPLHCKTALQAKEAEIHALLWRLQYELRRRANTLPEPDAGEGASAACEPPAPRTDATAAPSPTMSGWNESDVQAELLEGLARRIPAEALGTPVTEAADADLLLAACQHTGMLAVLRWLGRPGAPWGDETLTRVAELPF